MRPGLLPRRSLSIINTVKINFLGFVTLARIHATADLVTVLSGAGGNDATLSHRAELEANEIGAWIGCVDR